MRRDGTSDVFDKDREDWEDKERVKQDAQIQIRLLTDVVITLEDAGVVRLYGVPGGQCPYPSDVASALYARGVRAVFPNASTWLRATGLLRDALVDAEELLALIERGVTSPDNVWQDHMARVRTALAASRRGSA